MKNKKASVIEAKKNEYKELSTSIAKKPLIGVYDDTMEVDGKTDRRRGIKFICYYIEKNGGIPLLIAPNSDVDALAKNIDGYVFPGGSDINPAFYGKEKHPETKVDESRENARFSLEEKFVRDAIKLEKPALAFCRGMQMTNVVMGKIWQEENPKESLGERGTLIQHVPERFPDDDVHQDPKAGELKPKDVVLWQDKADESKQDIPHPFESSHDIRVLPESKFAQIIGKQKGADIGCFSFHHQAVCKETLAPQLKPCAYGVKKDGSLNDEIIEAAEYKNILIIQSHAETGVANIANSLFANLIKDSQENMLKREKERKIDIDLISPHHKEALLVIKNLKKEAYGENLQNAPQIGAEIIKRTVKNR